MTNPVLRPASLSDLLRGQIDRKCSFGYFTVFTMPNPNSPYNSMKRLYDAEWRLRGFQWSP